MAAKRINHEHIEQKSLFEWVKTEGIYYDSRLEMMFAIPNGAFFGRDKRAAIIQSSYLKAEGVKNGVPDICLPVPKIVNKVCIHFGLFIEMKYGSNTASVEQIEYMNKLNSIGYKAIICKSCDSAKLEILKYLSIV